MDIQAAVDHACGAPLPFRWAGFRLTGPLDLSALREAWGEAVRAHRDGSGGAGSLCLTDFGSLTVAGVGTGVGTGTGAGPDADALAAELCDRWAAEPVPSPSGVRISAARLAPLEHVLFVAADRPMDEDAFVGLLGLLTAAYGRRRTGTDGAPGGSPAPATASPASPGREAERPRYDGAVLPFSWDGDLARDVATVADSEGASPAGVVLAAFRALLLRRGGRAGGATFRELLARMPHPGRGPSDVPGCDAVFADHRAARAALRLAGVRARPVAPGRARLSAGLALVLDEVSPAIAGRLEYRPAVYDTDAATDVLDRLRAQLTAAAAAPAAPVAEPPPRPDLTAAKGAAARPAAGGPPGARAVPASVAGHAGTGGPAVVWAGRATDYRRLDALAGRIAWRLGAVGVGRGDSVAVRMPPGPLRIAALLGVMASGARLLWMAPGPAGERGRAMLAALRPACLLVEDEPDGDDLVRWYRDGIGGRVLAAAEGGPRPAAFPAPPAVDPGDHAYVAFTSGSTGRPKGIVQTHGALAQFAHWMGDRFGMGPGARVAQWVSPEHDPALAEVCATLVAGGTLYVLPEEIRLNPDRLVPWLAEQRITHLQTVPGFARDLVEVIAGTAAGRRPRCLSHLLLMGEALTGELVGGLRRVLPDTRIFNLYGPTETIAATWHEATDAVSGPVPIGRPIPGRQVLVLDEDDLTCPVGVTGGIVVRSPHVTPGYLDGGDGAPFRPVDWLDDPEDPAGWYRTGDLGRRLPDGTLEFRGREDFQIKLSGNRVELTEIEASLAAHASVLECAVVPLVEARSGLVRRLAVHVVPRRDAAGRPVGAAREWRAHLRRHFGALHLPATFHEVPGRLPRNAAGKVDRSRLRTTAPVA
ncbi:AMP-binding protein [Streptomyces taklimakanensis]|uniref:AMP-binding protein n=1 Tax=Streptomyces taklimakanensis TaxID=2569853 RepID=UPI00308424FB